MNANGLLVALLIIIALDSVTCVVLISLEDWAECSVIALDRLETCRKESLGTEPAYAMIPTDEEDSFEFGENFE